MHTQKGESSDFLPDLKKLGPVVSGDLQGNVFMSEPSEPYERWASSSPTHSVNLLLRDSARCPRTPDPEVTVVLAALGLSFMEVTPQHGTKVRKGW